MRYRRGDYFAFILAGILALAAMLSILTNLSVDIYRYTTAISRIDKLSTNLFVYPIKSLLNDFSNRLIRNQTSLDFVIAGDNLKITGIDNISPATQQASWLPVKFLSEKYSQKVKIRGKGLSPPHFLGVTKSFKLKTKKKRLFPGNERELEFELPTHPAIIPNYVAFKIAEKLDLLMPSHQILYGQVGTNYPRLFEVIGSIDEQLLRNQSLMPGDIYGLNITGHKRGGDPTLFGIRSGFSDSLLWRKVATYNHFSEHNFMALDRLLYEISRSLETGQSENLLALIDVDYFAKLLILLQLAQSNHLDNVHNTAIYYDPWRNKFFPIIDDLMAWHKPFGSSFEQQIPAHEPIITDFLSTVSLNNDFFDTVKKIPAIQRRMKEIWPTIQEKISEELTRGEQYFSRQMSKVRGNLFTEIGSSFYSAEELMRANRIFLDYSRSSFDYLVKRFSEPSTDEDTPPPSRPLKVFSGVNIISGTRDYRHVFSFVEPGTTFLLEKNATILFSDSELAGTKLLPIKFIQARQGDRFGAVIFESADKVELAHVVVEGGSGLRSAYRQYSGQLNFHAVKKLNLNNVKASNSSKDFDDNVHIVYVDRFLITDLEVFNSPNDGVDIDISNGTLDGVETRNNGNDGIDLMTSKVEILRSRVYQNGDKGISVGENSQAELRWCELRANKIGLEIKDRSKVSVDNTGMFENELDINLYQKNWRFGAGGEIGLGAIERKGNLRIEFDKESRVTDL